MRSLKAWRKRRLHFIGIGGAGMSGLALVSSQLGAEVSGSDQSESSYLARLKSAGINFAVGHDTKNLPVDAEVVVSTAIAEDNPELKKARESGYKILHRADLLAELTRTKKTVAVSGSHGKTTTTAMIAHILHMDGADPAYLIGGEVAGLGGNAAWGDGPLVVEADESDRSFLKLDPDLVVITNVELDHHSTYKTSQDLRESFSQFAGLAPSKNLVVWSQVEDLAETSSITYGVGGLATYSCRSLRADATGIGCKLLKDGKEISDLELSLHGEYNILNALAAIAACQLLGVEPRSAAKYLADFSGVDRRFQLVGHYRGATVYDDYAHHPTEVVATLTAARELQPQRLVAAFQPHLYSRTKSLYREFGQALAAADLVVVGDVYAAREQPTGELAGISGKLVADAVADTGAVPRIFWAPSLNEMEEALGQTVKGGDLVLTIGAGDVHRVAESIVVNGD